jgi:hypothetical protein
MALIRATCSDCGDVELRSRDLTIRACPELESSNYLFRCPSCSQIVVKSADNQIVEILTAAGVPTIRWKAPTESLPSPALQPITHDDLLGFHELLESETWLAELAGLEGQ